jgi:putative oxidoreductase
MEIDRNEKSSLHSLAPFLARVLISILFISLGLLKIFSTNLTFPSLQQRGLSLGERGYLISAITIQLVCSLLLLLGWKTRWACAILMIILLPITLVLHDFWDPQVNQVDQFVHFVKNLSIYGGLILLATYGPGKWSLDFKRAQKKKQ